MPIKTTPCEERGRDQGDASTRQGTPKMASNHQKLRQTWDRISLMVLKRNQGWGHLDLGDFLAFRTMRQYVSIVKATQFVVLCYSNPGKPIHLCI